MIIATSVHRRMTGPEMRHIVGDKIFNAYYPTASTTTTPKT